MQVSTDANAERVEKLGVGRITGALLVAMWAGVLVAVIVLRRNTDYVHHEALYWWEAFYRTGSIIFGGGQVRIAAFLYDLQVTAIISRLENGMLQALLQKASLLGLLSTVSSADMHRLTERRDPVENLGLHTLNVVPLRWR